MNAIVVPEHFIRAARDAGYRSLAFALSELIDNALDAGANSVEVSVREERIESEREITIAVLDNGKGMDAKTVWEALRFGGSERFNGRSRLGRYGMGLPNSSVSQAPRVDVYTWRRPGRCKHTFLDVEEIANRRQPGIPKPTASRLPTWVATESPTGTLVLWSRCDRLRFKKAVTIADKLRAPIGRIYRVELESGLDIQINGIPVVAVDPLLRSTQPELPGACKPFGEPLVYRIRAPHGGLSQVTVQFVEFPVSRWHLLPAETKRHVGIVGGGGMSILRAGREIDYGWHLFGSKRRENYDDWWRCELRFEPALDELFGITHNKQGINPVPELREILEPDLEAVARQLNGRVRAAFRVARPSPPKRGAARASGRDHLLPPVRSSASRARRNGTAGYAYQMGLHQKPTAEFFRFNLSGGTLALDINENHPFYQRMYKQLLSTASEEATDLLLLSAARALADLPKEKRAALLRRWSDNLAAFLDG